MCSVGDGRRSSLGPPRPRRGPRRARARRPGSRTPELRSSPRGPKRCEPGHELRGRPDELLIRQQEVPLTRGRDEVAEHGAVLPDATRHERAVDPAKPKKKTRSPRMAWTAGHHHRAKLCEQDRRAVASNVAEQLACLRERSERFTCRCLPKGYERSQHLLARRGPWSTAPRTQVLHRTYSRN